MSLMNQQELRSASDKAPKANTQSANKRGVDAQKPDNPNRLPKGPVLPSKTTL